MNGKILCVLLTAISMIGCTTMRPVDTRQPELERKLSPNDHLLVYEKSGRVIDMTFIELDAEILRGRLTDGSQGPTSVDIAEIERLEIEKVDGVKTTLAVIGGTIIIVPIALIAGMAEIMAAQ
ncbi:hypothetical protein GWP57_09000 [Gammaproteobacteria bacterium]|jgi:hypothetical protein|nr:hypothetical protein [Gammaproteobacteria bacterium]